MGVRWVIFAILLPMLASCATVLKDPRQDVLVLGASKGVVLSTKYQSFTLKDGPNIVWLERDVVDIVATIKCSESAEAQMIYLKTRPSRLYVAGNFFFFLAAPYGWLLDYLTKQGWNIDSPVDIGSYCS